MDISVILTTARFGGWDILSSAMHGQKFGGSFEVIVADEFYDDRMGKIKWCPEFEHSKFDLLHIPPKRPCRIYDDSLGINTALAAASGELIVVLADYTWVPPDYLQAHWDFYKANPGWSMSCHLDRYPLPPMKSEPYSIERDWWTIWNPEEFYAGYAADYFACNEPAYRERRGCTGNVQADGKVEVPGEYVYLLGDSFPLSVAKELNSLDERYIGGYGSNDIDFGMRANYIRHHWALNPHIKLKKMTLSGQAQIPGKAKPKVRTPEDNYRFFQARRQAITDGRETPRTPTGWGLE